VRSTSETDIACQSTESGFEETLKDSHRHDENHVTVPDAAALFDSLVIAAIAGEIRAEAGARFAGVRQPAPDTIVLSLTRARTIRHLLCCIHPRMARIHFAARPEATERLAPFGTLLRSRLVDARLADVQQPPFNRVLRLRFDALTGPLWLIGEVMGRHSNLVLSDGRVVLGALKVVTTAMSPRRPVLPGRPYRPAPADRPTPEALDPAGLRDLLHGSLPLVRRLSQSILGLSPQMAREVALRAGLDPALPAAEAAAGADEIHAVLAEIGATLRAGQFAPTLYTDGARIVAYAAMPMRIFAHLAAQRVETMSEAVDRFSRQGGETSPREERRRQLATAVASILGRREAALEENRRILAESQHADRYRVLGDLVLTYARQAGPRDSTLRVPDHTAGGAEITIPLDPALSPSENAQQYFRRYAKARAAGRAVPARIVQLEAEAEALRGALVQIETASSPDDLWEIENDLAAAGIMGRRSRSRPPVRSGPRRFRTPDGSTIVVGRSGRENDRITFHEAGPEDLWLHARGVAGAHVILKSGGAPAEEGIVLAARTAAYYSESRMLGQVAVDCVARKYVRKPKGAAPGTVAYSGERTLLVAPGLPPGRPAQESGDATSAPRLPPHPRRPPRRHAP
jgi:predicted ribosome quality control (RQC) complex YloA/Tae2 family protein